MSRISILCALALAGCATVVPPDGAVRQDTAPAAVAGDGDRSGPIILDQQAAERLLAAKTLTLQWIGWDRRGTVRVERQGDTIRLTGAHNQTDGPGRLVLDGTVTEIGADYFIFDGLISITDTPDPGRRCAANKQWRFAITQNRPYWRLREFEWCDGLTDYIDIYF